MSLQRRSLNLMAATAGCVAVAAVAFAAAGCGRGSGHQPASSGTSLHGSASRPSPHASQGAPRPPRTKAATVGIGPSDAGSTVSLGVGDRLLVAAGRGWTVLTYPRDAFAPPRRVRGGLLFVASRPGGGTISVARLLLVARACGSTERAAVQPSGCFSGARPLRPPAFTVDLLVRPGDGPGR